MNIQQSYVYICEIFTQIWLLKSVGLKLFSILSLQVVWMLVRLGVLLFYLYLTLNFVISSLIVGTCRPACKTLLDIYRGAFTYYCSEDVILLSL